jgi:hypothetical protein
VLYYEKFTVRLFMRKTQMSPDSSGCASKTKWTNWYSINWKKVHHGVKSLQRRIVKAVESKYFHKAKVLLYLLARSFYGKLLAILRVTSNTGSRTCGVDNVRWNTPARKWKAIEQLSIKGYKAEPLKRKSIPKKNGKLRHLGIPTMRDRAVQAMFKAGLEPVAEATADLNSYGFRPKRSCADAIEQCHNVLARGNSAEWIFEADIKGRFDNISHEWILQHIPVNKMVLGQWVKGIYSAIRECITGNKTVKQDKLIAMITPKIRGWGNFYRHVVSKRTFSILDEKLFRLLWKWAKRRHPNKSSYWIKQHYFISKENQNWVFATTGNRKHVELPRFDAIKIVRHRKIISISNPYNRKWDNYFAERVRDRLVKPKLSIN